MVFFTNLAGSLLAFSLIFGFFLSCRRFSVALKLVGALAGMGIWGFTLKLKAQLDSVGLNPSSGSLETRLRVNHRFVT